MTLLGLGSNVVLTAGKGLAGLWMNSASLLAEAGHSLSDLLGVSPCLCSIMIYAYCSNTGVIWDERAWGGDISVVPASPVADLVWAAEGRGGEDTGSLLGWIRGQDAGSGVWWRS